MMLYCFESGEITGIRMVCMMILSGFLFTVKIPPHKRGPWLFVYYGKLVYTPIGTAGINDCLYPRQIAGRFLFWYYADNSA
jgi:hypothetical protein